MPHTLDQFAVFFNPTLNDYGNIVSIPDDDTGFITLGDCVNGWEGKPGAAALDCWDYGQVWMGWPWVTYTADLSYATNLGAFRYQWGLNINAGKRGKVIFYYFNPRTASWEVKTGIMREPVQSGQLGDAAQTVQLTFTKIGGA